MPPKAKKEILYRYNNEDKNVCSRHRNASCEGFYLCEHDASYDPMEDLSVEKILEHKAFIAFYIMIHFDMIHDFADAKQDIVEAILNFLNSSEVRALINTNDPFYSIVAAIIEKLESGGSLTQGKLTNCKFGAYKQQMEKLAEIPNINVHFEDTQFVAMIHCDGDSPFQMLAVDETGEPSLEPFLDCGPTPEKKKKKKSGYIGDDPIYYPALIVGEIQGIGYIYNLIDLEQNLPVDHSPQNWRFGVVNYNIPFDPATMSKIPVANYIKLGDYIYTNRSNGRDFWKNPLVQSKITGQIEEGGDWVTVDKRKAGTYISSTSERLTQNNIVTILSGNNRVDGSGWHKKLSSSQQDWVFNKQTKSIPNAIGGFYTYSSDTTTVYSFIGASPSEDQFRAYKLVFKEQFLVTAELERQTMIHMSSQLLSTAYASPISCYRLAGHEDLACADQWSEVLETYLMNFNEAASSNEFKVFIDADGSRFRMAPLMNMLCSVLQERASRVEFIMTPGNYYDAATDSGVRKYLESFHRRTRERRIKSGDRSAYRMSLTNKKYQKWLINQQCNTRLDAKGVEVPNGIINYKIGLQNSSWRMFDWTIQYDASQIMPQFDILGDDEPNPISQVMGNINQWGNCGRGSPPAISKNNLSAKKDAKGKSQTSRDAIWNMPRGSFCDLAYKTIGDLTKIMDSVEYAKLNSDKAVLYLTLDIISAQIAALLGGNHRNYTVLLEDKSGAIYTSKGGTTKNLSAEGSLIVFNNLPGAGAGAGAGAGGISDSNTEGDINMEGGHEETKDEIKEPTRAKKKPKIDTTRERKKKSPRR